MKYTLQLIAIMAATLFLLAMPWWVTPIFAIAAFVFVMRRSAVAMQKHQRTMHRRHPSLSPTQSRSVDA